MNFDVIKRSNFEYEGKVASTQQLQFEKVILKLISKSMNRATIDSYAWLLLYSNICTSTKLSMAEKLLLLIHLLCMTSHIYTATSERECSSSGYSEIEKISMWQRVTCVAIIIASDLQEKGEQLYRTLYIQKIILAPFNVVKKFSYVSHFSVISHRAHVYVTFWCSQKNMKRNKIHIFTRLMVKTKTIVRVRERKILQLS